MSYRSSILAAGILAAWAVSTVHATAAAPESRAMRLVAPNTGWVLAGNRLLWTSSAGLEWRDITPPASPDRALYGAFFLDTQRGWALRAGFGAALELARTSDGGAHWSIHAFPLAAQDAANFGRSVALDFIDAAHGWAMLRLTSNSNFSLGALLATSDGGATWTRLPDPPLGEPVRFTSTAQGWLAGGPGNRVYVTGDGGRSWQSSVAPPPPEPAGAYAWKIASEGHCTGFKTGCRQVQKLLATSDAGRTFQDITPAAAGASPDTTENGLGEGFDQCAVGSTGAMQTWWTASPYYYANVYIGGVNRACSQSNLSTSWINTVVAQGWRLFPTWVGPQAPCTTCSGCSRISSNTSTAAMQGTSQAKGAAQAASQLGMRKTVVYYDMEYYNPDSSCIAAVQAFVNAWTVQLHAYGTLAGVYGSPYNATDWVVANPPDDVWIADWNYVDSVWGLYPLSDSLWVGHQRLHQYVGGHNETWGGVTFNIDNDVLDGAVTP